jgi:hypothetical protein
VVSLVLTSPTTRPSRMTVVIRDREHSVSLRDDDDGFP